MKRAFTAAALALGAFSFAGCGEETGVEKKTTIEGTGGTTTIEEKKSIETTGDNPPPVVTPPGTDMPK
jgi:hypothetical protein